ncbi:MAG: hypothetical protein ABI693_23115 [Bryobacteraceae bacterium]
MEANSWTLAHLLTRLSTAPSGVYVSILLFIPAVIALIAVVWAAL